MLVILWECGLRIAELVELRLCDLPTFHGRNEIQVHGKGGKFRKVEIGLGLRLFLEFYVSTYKRCCDKDNYLFLSESGGRLSTGAARKKLKRLAIKARIWKFIDGNGRTKTKFTPHCMRHSFGMNLLDSSGDLSTVQQEMGHKSIAITQIYAYTLPAKRQEQIEESSRKSKVASGVDLQKLTTPSEN